MDMHETKIAVIDLGSNSVRLDLVILRNDGTWKRQTRLREMVRLSEGMQSGGMMQAKAMDRTIEALKGFRTRIDAFGAEQIIAVATAAVRMAKNQRLFCDRVSRETGIDLQVITGEQEAALDFKGVMAALPGLEDCVITDTGGGSTELIAVRKRAVTAAVSLPIGAMNLTQRFGGPLRGEDLLAARCFVREQMQSQLFLKKVRGLPVVGMGGSLCALGTVFQALNGISGGVHGCMLTRAQAEDTARRILAMSTAQRLQTGIEAGRTDTVCAGLIPALVLMEVVDSPSLTLCTAGLREGLLAQRMDMLS